MHVHVHAHVHSPGMRMHMYMYMYMYMCITYRSVRRFDRLLSKHHDGVSACGTKPRRAHFKPPVALLMAPFMPTSEEVKKEWLRRRQCKPPRLPHASAAALDNGFGLLLLPEYSQYLEPLDLILVACCRRDWYQLNLVDQRLEDRVRDANRTALWIIVWRLLDALADQVGPDQPGSPRSARFLWFLAARQVYAEAALVCETLQQGGCAAGSAMLALAEDNRLAADNPDFASTDPATRRQARTSLYLRNRARGETVLLNGRPPGDLDLWVPIPSNVPPRVTRSADIFDTAVFTPSQMYGCHLRCDVAIRALLPNTVTTSHRSPGSGAGPAITAPSKHRPCTSRLKASIRSATLPTPLSPNYAPLTSDEPSCRVSLLQP